MPRIFLAMLVFLFWSTPSWAQAIPTVLQWLDIFEEVRQHRLFSDLEVAYAKTPAESVDYSPVGVMPRAGLDCVVVVSEGDNPKMVRMMALNTSPEAARAFLLTIAAHEFGHCHRIRTRNLTVQLWERALATAAGSSERREMERVISIEEGYADAYAFAYIRDAHPQMYAAMFRTMHILRHAPTFATPFYQVEPLYVRLDHKGLDVNLPLHLQVEAVMRESKF